MSVRNVLRNTDCFCAVQFGGTVATFANAMQVNNYRVLCAGVVVSGFVLPESDVFPVACCEVFATCWADVDREKSTPKITKVLFIERKFGFTKVKK